MALLWEVWQWLNGELLQMKWLFNLVKLLVESVWGLPISEGVGGSIHFFIYDSLKIFLLLGVLIYGISYLQSYFPPERTKKILGKFQGVTGNLMGALLGTVTPFCSCSSIPLFIGFTEAGLPLGVTFSFLISSPLVDLAAFLVLLSVFGFKIAFAYVVVGIILAVGGGWLINRLRLEKYVEEYVWQMKIPASNLPELSRRARLAYAWGQVREIVGRVWLYILVGVGIGAVIHNWIPRELIERVIGVNNPWAVILATLVGIPMYADIFGTIPVAEALFAKGVGVGTVLALMMAVTALSLPALILLRKVIKPQLLGVFMGVVAGGIIFIGYLFNALAVVFK